MKDILFLLQHSDLLASANNDVQLQDDLFNIKESLGAMVFLPHRLSARYCQQAKCDEHQMIDLSLILAT